MKHEQVAASGPLHAVAGDDGRTGSEPRRVRGGERRREVPKIIRIHMSLLSVGVLLLCLVVVAAGSGVRIGVVEGVPVLLLVASRVEPPVVIHLCSWSNRHHRDRNHRGHHVGHLRHRWVHMWNTLELVIVAFLSSIPATVELTIKIVEIHLPTVANGIEQ